MKKDTPPAPPFNIASLMQRAAAARPYQRAVVFPWQRDRAGRVAYTHLTFEQLNRESDRLAHGLSEVGIQQGTRTIFMVKPGLEFFVLTFALFKVGAIPVVVDPGMGLDRMLRCLRESRAQAFVGIPLAHALRMLYPRYFKNVLTHVTVGPRWPWSGHSIRSLRASRGTPWPLAATRVDEPAAILFTTGSTGPAKGVNYTHGIFRAQIEQIRSHFDIKPDEIDLPTFPLFALFDPALGMTAVIPDMDPTKPAKVNPVRIIEAIYNHGVTNMFASPALLNRVGRYGQKKGIKLPSLRRVVSAGAPVAPAIIARFVTMLDKKAQIHTPYGATEAMPIFSIGSREIMSETRRLSEQGRGMCVGRPLEGIEVRIIRISDEPIEKWSDDWLAAEGDVGEIIVRGELVTKSYFERPHDDALSKIRHKEQVWHRMGDLGWRDAKGRIWFCGRKSHRVITADGTLFTIPCEAIFNRHPSVFRSALVGIGAPGRQLPVICIELEATARSADRSRLRQELLDLGKASAVIRPIHHLLFHDAFPVDIRHNSKIFREQLAVWAAKKLKHH